MSGAAEPGPGAAAAAEPDSEELTAPEGERERSLRRRAAAGTMAGFLAGASWAPQAGPASVERLLEAFEALHAERPVRDNSGGSRWAACAWLFVLARLIGPHQIVESGTHRGQTAWLLSRACPQATVATFDITHELLEHREPGVTYVLGDWSAERVRARPGATALAFFDDHVSQARRVVEAAERGFAWALLDDALPSWMLGVTGVPPAPTLPMLDEPDLVPGTVIRWRRRGRSRSLEITAELEREMAEARARLAHWALLPELGPVAGVRPLNGLALARLATA